MSAIWSLSGKKERRGHLAFVDAEVRRGGPLLEVAGTAEKLGEPPQVPRGCCEQHFVPAHNAWATLPRQKSICDNQSHHARENQQGLERFWDYWPGRIAGS